MSESYANIFRVHATGLRFFTVSGPWGRPDMALWIFTKALYAGTPLPLFNRGEVHRALTSIDNIVTGIVSCLVSRPKDDTFVKAGAARGRTPSTISATIAGKT